MGAFAALLLITGVASCSSDGYETGDGRYSYLQADFCKAHVTTAKTVDYILTDGGDSVHLATPATVGWAERHVVACAGLLRQGGKEIV